MHVTAIILGVVLPSTIAWPLFSYSSPQQEVVGPSSRPLSFLKYLNPFSFLVVRQESQPKTTALGLCDGNRGQKVGEECLEFVSTPRNFFDAAHFCRNGNGTLWVPTTDDLSSPFFFQKLLSSFPEFFKAMSSEVLVGISKGMTTGYKGVDGTDLSAAPWVKTNDEPKIKDNLCSAFDYSLGHLQFQPVKCDVVKNFVCEYRPQERRKNVQQYDNGANYYKPNRLGFFGKPFY